MSTINEFTATSNSSTIDGSVTIDNSGGDGIVLPGGPSYWDLNTAATVEAAIGIYIDGPLDVTTNQAGAIIYGVTEAAFMAGALATLINYGLLSSGTLGVLITNGSTLINDAGGLVNAGTSGIGVELGASAYAGRSSMVMNRGTITGRVGVSVEPGNTTAITVINGGVIESAQGATGQAVRLDDGGLLELQSTSTIVGTASAMAGTLALYGISNTIGIVSGLGSSFTGFDTISIQNSATWDISGNAGGLASGQKILNFGPGDLITLTGVGAVSVSPTYQFGIGGLTIGGSTLDIQDSNLSTGDFLVSGNPGSVTIGVKPESGVVTIDVNALQGISTTGTKDDTAIINNAISAVPNGETIDLNFGSGTFAIDGTVVLRSDTNVQGSNATIVAAAAQQDAGTLSQFQNQNFNGSGSQTNTNISIRGLTFVYPQPIWDIAIWFQNVSQVEISSNTFLAANNGDIALLDASSSVISDNVANGNINIAYNGWNGLSNIAVNNNSDYQSGSAAGSGGYFFNGTFAPQLGQIYQGGNFKGNQFDNYFSNNISAGALPGGAGFALGTLGYGYTTNTNSNMQGNLDAVNGTPSTFGFMDLGAGSNNVMQANIVSQHVAGNPEQTNAFASNGGGAGSLAAVGSAIIGNEVFGSTRSYAQFQNQGDASTTSNDAIIGAQNSSEYTPLVGIEDPGGAAPIVSGVGGSIGFGTITGGAVALGITISGIDNLLVAQTSLTALAGVVLSDTDTLGNELITLEVSDIFGTLSLGGQTGQTITIVGSLAQLNAEVAKLGFVSNSGGWNDDIHFSATDSLGNRAVWDVAVGIGMPGTLGGQGIGTFSSVNSTNQQPNLQPLTNDPVPAPLGGDTLVVQGGGHSIVMGGLVSMVLTGDGSNTISGGTGPGYVQTDTGPVQINLNQGGDVTVSGGVGGVAVVAASGNDLIQSASGPIQAVLGSGADTILAGIGGASVTGGSGIALVTTLPQDGGPLTVALGSGGGSIYALSGIAAINTRAGAHDTLYAGQGTVNLSSGGFDQIFGGSGDVSIYGGASASDSVFGGSGSVYLEAGGGSSYISPGSGLTDIVAGSGNLVIASTGQFLLTIDSLSGANRTVALNGIGAVELVGFGATAIVSQSLVAGVLSIELTDGTQILMSDAVGEFATTNLGTLMGTGWSIAGTGTAQIVSGSAGSTLAINGPTMTLAGTLGAGSPTIFDVSAESQLILNNLNNGVGLDQLTLSGTLLDVRGNLAIGGIDLNGGQFQIDPATVTSSGITGTGAVTIDAHTSLGVSGSIGNGVTIDFNGLNGTLGISGPASMAGMVDGFSYTDSVEFSSSSPLTETYAANANGGGSLSIFQGGTQIGAVGFGDGSFSSSSFVLTNLGNGIEQIAVACFVKGTPIRTADGDRAIETLHIGDNILTHDGRSVPIKWIARKCIFGGISYEDFPVLFPKGCLGQDLPTSDLTISSDHALLVGGLLMPAALLCNGNILKINPGEVISYYHIETYSHEIILAAGVPVETFIDVHNRAGFDNVEEYKRLYGAALAPPIAEFAPRLVAGELACSVIANAFGSNHFLADIVDDSQPLRGHLDQATENYVQGWARAGGNSTIVEISVNGRVRGYINANDFRMDLLTAGIADGFAAFRFEFAEPLSAGITNTVSAKIVGTSFVLEGAPARVSAESNRTREIGSIEIVRVAEAAVEAALTSIMAVRTDSRPIALVLDDAEPDPDRDAGSEAILCHTAILTKIGYRVLFVARRGIVSSQSRRSIQHAGAEAVMAAGARAIETILDTFQIDLAFIHRPIIAVSYAGLIRARSPNCKIVMSVADLEHLRFDSLFRLIGHQCYADERALSLRRLDQAMHLVDQVITHSETERSWLTSKYPAVRANILLWTPMARRVETDFTCRTGVGFIGSMGHAPNLDAVFWIDRVIEPVLRRKGATFGVNLIGSEFPESFHFLERTGLTCCGQVPDLGAALGRLRATVAPLRAGAGVKGKVLSSLHAGVPCIMSSIAADGLKLPHDLMALVYDDPDGIAARIIDVHETRSTYEKISVACLAWADENLATGAIVRQMEAALFEPAPRTASIPTYPVRVAA